MHLDVRSDPIGALLKSIAGFSQLRLKALKSLLQLQEIAVPPEFFPVPRTRELGEK
jgi:hypothetical protein